MRKYEFTPYEDSESLNKIHTYLVYNDILFRGIYHQAELLPYTFKHYLPLNPGRAIIMWNKTGIN